MPTYTIETKTAAPPPQYSFLDKGIHIFNQALKTLAGTVVTTERPIPGIDTQPPALTSQEMRHVAGLMRVNHAGEVAAQGLYQGQALTAELPDIRTHMQRAAEEESDHLAWCEHRLNTLNSHTSLLSPLWYSGAFLIGAIAGVMGDQWSLGFVAETERQVTLHLTNHLTELPVHDTASRAILEKMREDETLHATTALEAGAAELPTFIKKLMRFTASIMTRTAYWI